MELKSIKTGAADFGAVSSNCTFMELKFLFLGRGDGRS